MKVEGKKDEWVRTALRLPRELHAVVHEAAKVNDRTFNGQIVAALRKSVAERQHQGPQHANAA